ncbi:MAG TPA: Xaa-Pro peptidase family protein [Mycobacteriales bacterium]|nr:Xaa-Pro peptidase family protein [Mycobacteriales bacterium]
MTGDGVGGSELYPAERLAVARDATARAGLDALLLTPGAQLRYLTGYAALALPRLTCLVLPVHGDPVLIVPELERPVAEASPAGRLGLEILSWPETADPYRLVAQRLHRPARVGLANRMWAEQVLRLRAALPEAEQVLAGDVLGELRVRKSAAEVAALRRAGAAIDRVHARMGEWLRPGRSEREVARDVGQAILDEGHAVVNFVIVAAGPNAASPHHHTGDRLLEPGDVVVVDIGGTTEDGYCSDSTRTYALGHAPGEFVEYYAVLQRAQQAAVGAVRPGVPAESVDAAARDLISAAGFGDCFVHRTGHGIGLEEHEEPWIVAGNGTLLEAGMTFSVEPGIYLRQRHGARIEDIVVCTGDGVERLNTLARDLVVLPER